MIYRYPPGAIYRDYLRGGIGVTLFLLPVAVFELPEVSIYICLIFSILFIFHLGQTVVRQRTCIDMDDQVIRNRGNATGFAWRDLNTFVLRYFSVRRDREAGWLEIRLGSERQRLRLDSRIEGFNEIAERAARAAADNQLRLDSATISNLKALGIQPAEAGVQRD